MAHRDDARGRQHRRRSWRWNRLRRCDDGSVGGGLARIVPDTVLGGDDDHSPARSYSRSWLPAVGYDSPQLAAFGGPQRFDAVLVDERMPV